MAVSTIYQPNQPSSKKYIIPVVAIVGVIALVYFGFGFAKNVSKVIGKSALSAELFFGDGEVFVEDESLGNTPLTSVEVGAGENNVRIKNDIAEYQTTLNFMAGSEVVLKRDLGTSQVFASGQNFWLEKGSSDSVLSIISDPGDADVYLDGTNVGKTPYSTNDLSAGNYDVRVEFAGYESQSARIEINDGHKLNASFTLFPKPVPDKVELLEGSTNLYDVYSDNLVVNSDTDAWVDAILYWNKTRGINLAGAGTNKELVFDFFLDYEGNLYDANGQRLTVDEKTAETLAGADKAAYLRRFTDGQGLSDAAKETYLGLGELGAGIPGGQTATILDTGLGWLRVRSEPSLTGTEIAQVNVGETFAVLEVQEEWVKIKVDDTTEGWVSATYVELSEETT